MTPILQQDIMYLTGVGPNRKKILSDELGISSFGDLLEYFPYKYVDRSKLYAIRELTTDMPFVQLCGKILGYETFDMGPRKQRVVAHFTDGNGVMDLTWFNGGQWAMKNYKVGEEYLVFGKPTWFNGRFNIQHPEIESLSKVELSTMGLQPYYPTTEKMKRNGLTSRGVEKLTRNLVDRLADELPETLPAEMVQRLHLMSRDKALRTIHYPQNVRELEHARARLKFEELFFVQLNIVRYASDHRRRYRGFVFSRIGSAFNDFYHHQLPFSLTEAQKRVLREIRKDVGSGRQMNRLLQGDVGSGKTLVALMAMLIAIDNGYQACIMAPTEILATQHFEAISEMAQKIGVKVGLLTGSTRKRQREEIHAGLLDGSLQLLIGTHALLEDTVQYKQLGLAIIDEQHRFGVAQRARLWRKNTTPPHVLVMTATPIPRTLSMTVYGDLDVSVIDELPPGRKPVGTYLRFEDQHEATYRFIGQELAKGRQAYIVYPLIEENEKLDLKALEEGFEIVKEKFPSYTVSMVHGKMRPAEKDYQMQLFASNQAQILVATTVIEVGVNVPNASVMIIENAERFGLSQLHQLRGRVGRGADQSYCILMSKHKLTKETRHRLEVMTNTNDGFVVAEEDMKLRGPGDMEGTQQSGIAFNLKVANLVTDGPIIEQAREDAIAVLAADPNLASPEGKMLNTHMQLLFSHKVNWGLIS